MNFLVRYRAKSLFFVFGRPKQKELQVLSSNMGFRQRLRITLSTLPQMALRSA